MTHSRPDIRPTPVMMLAECGQRRQFQKRGSGIDQQVDPLARQHLAARLVARPRHLPAAARDQIELVAQFGDERAHGFRVAREIRRGRIDAGMERHGLRVLWCAAIEA
jgi:hypothetical protein